MGMPAFLQKQQEDQAKNRKSNKGNFRSRCILLLNLIKTYDENRYHELHRVFHAKYDKENIQKKVILGFYGQLKNEIRQFKIDKGEIKVNKVVQLPKHTPKPVKIENKVEKTAFEKPVERGATSDKKKEVKTAKTVAKAVKKVAAKKKPAAKAKKKVAAKKKPAAKAKKKVAAKNRSAASAKAKAKKKVTAKKKTAKKKPAAKAKKKVGKKKAKKAA